MLVMQSSSGSAFGTDGIGSHPTELGNMLMTAHSSNPRIGARGWYLLVAIAVAGLSCWYSAGAALGQGKAKSKTTAPAAAPELAADLEDAIRVVEAGEFQKFLERYAPVDILRRMRQDDVVEQAAGMLAQQPQGKAQLLAILRALQKQTPRYDKSHGFATLEFDPLASGVPEAVGELHLPTGADLKLTGLGDDLPKALAEAIRLLEAGDIAGFAERMFPPTEVARLRQGDQMAALVQQFKEIPELPAAMLADFKRMQAAKPELTEKGQVAVFKLAAGKGAPERAVKLQKGKGGWRLYDDSPRVSAELTRQAKLRPGSSVMNVQMELIGGNWRFVELPLFGPSAN